MHILSQFTIFFWPIIIMLNYIIDFFNFWDFFVLNNSKRHFEITILKNSVDEESLSIDLEESGVQV